MILFEEDIDRCESTGGGVSTDKISYLPKDPLGLVFAIAEMARSYTVAGARPRISVSSYDCHCKYGKIRYSRLSLQ